MGKSITPYSHVVDQVETAFSDFRRALTRADQARFDTLFNYARRHTPGGVLQSDPDPFRTVLLGMLIELMRRLDESSYERSGGSGDETVRLGGGGASPAVSENEK